MTAVHRFLAEQLIYPQEAIDAEVKGQMMTEFIVDKSGSLSGIIIIRDLGFGTGKEVISVLKTMPKWKPALLNGVPVNLMYRLPVSVKLQQYPDTTISIPNSLEQVPVKKPIQQPKKRAKAPAKKLAPKSILQKKK